MHFLFVLSFFFSLPHLPFIPNSVLFCSFSGEGHFPGVINLFGNFGKLVESRASLLASHGFVALALAYCDCEDLPSQLKKVDLEYFEEATNFLLRHPKVIFAFSVDLSPCVFNNHNILWLLLISKCDSPSVKFKFYYIAILVIEFISYAVPFAQKFEMYKKFTCVYHGIIRHWLWFQTELGYISSSIPSGCGNLGELLRLSFFIC